MIHFLLNKFSYIRYWFNAFTKHSYLIYSVWGDLKEDNSKQYMTFSKPESLATHVRSHLAFVRDRYHIEKPDCAVFKLVLCGKYNLKGDVDDSAERKE